MVKFISHGTGLNLNEDEENSISFKRIIVKPSLQDLLPKGALPPPIGNIGCKYPARYQVGGAPNVSQFIARYLPVKLFGKAMIGLGFVRRKYTLPKAKSHIALKN